MNAPEPLRPDAQEWERRKRANSRLAWVFALIVLALFALAVLGCKMLVGEYQHQTALPKESALAAEVGRTRELLEQQAESRRAARPPRR